MQHWIKMDRTLSSNPKVRMIGQMCGLPTFHVVGCLHAIWSMADQFADETTGRMMGNAAILDEEVRHEGFAEAMESVGWLAIEPRHLLFPNYAEHNGSTAKQRASKNKRQAKWRDGGAPVGAFVDAPVDAQPSTEAPTRIEERREEKKREEASASSCGQTQASGPPPTPPAPADGKSNASNSPTAPQPRQASHAPMEPFACDGHPRSWRLPAKKLDQWQRLYPSLDCLAECRKARQWIEDNPRRRKTAAGMTRFLGNWLSKAQNDPKRRYADAATDEDHRAVRRPARVEPDRDRPLRSWSPSDPAGATTDRPPKTGGPPDDAAGR
jgi:hypothetical protein